MKLSRIRIKNFRGIANAQIDLQGGPPGRVVTLIGLNESGKTTVLEAISNFVSRDTATTSLVETYYSKVETSSFIPKHRRGRFTDRVSIEGDALFDDSDKLLIIESAKTLGASVVPESISSGVKIERAFDFEDSKLSATNSYWTFQFSYTTGKGKKVNKHNGGEDPIWQHVVNQLKMRLPEIVYFPTFLFDVPDRIYLEDISDESIQNTYYRRVLTDVLHAVDPAYSLETHIVKRVKAAENAGATERFFRALLGTDVQGDIDTVVREISNEISRVIIGAWDEIFGRKLVNKRIELSWDIDPAKGNAVYIELYIIDGQSKYLLRERSLGFRWFFSFLLFTQFRAKNNDDRATIFLFDEPASHLHSGAQMKLLESFEKIASDKDLIVYSTHSHYMVNPSWLEKAYIIDNKAIDLSSEDFDQFSVNPNDVQAVPYRQFVANNPSRITYFQPVFDALQYKVSPMQFRGPAVFLEGKFDYFPFVYLQERSRGKEKLAAFPVNGAGDLGSLITLFRGWAVPFVVLLDADPAGKREKARYIKNYHLRDEQIGTIDEFVTELTGKCFDDMYDDDVGVLITSLGVGRGNKIKEDAAALFQALIANGDQTAKIPKTLPVFQRLIDGLRKRLSQQD